MSFFFLLRPLFDGGNYAPDKSILNYYVLWNVEKKTYETSQEIPKEQEVIQERKGQRDRPTFTNIIRSSEGRERLKALDEFLERLNLYAAQINQGQQERMRRQLLLERAALIEHLKMLEDEELLLMLMT